MRQSIFTKVFLVTIFFGFFFSSFAQELTGVEASSRYDGAVKVWVKDGRSIPSHIVFSTGNEVPESSIYQWIKENMYPYEGTSFVTISEEVDAKGGTHRRVGLTYESVQLFEAVLVLHIRDGNVYSLNGDIPDEIVMANSFALTEADALQFALSHVDAERYKWEMPEEEALLKMETDNPQASYYPVGKKMAYKGRGEAKYKYVWVFNIYADKPLYRADVFVDALNGEILFEHNFIRHQDVPGVAVTKYSGTQNIVAYHTGSLYQLKETGRGQGIETYNLQNSTSYGNATLFTDDDNYWNNVNANQDEIAGDAHWGTEMTYDYYFLKHGRNSIDDNGHRLRSYVHYDLNYTNAFWDGQRMIYGDGDGSSFGPFTALDITAHEITHGLTSYTADLTYQDEPGALNEAYSDIFACAVEKFAKPAAANWLIGEDIGVTLRSLANPKVKGLPNCYQGAYWYKGTDDHGGVHTNNGPLAYWFYLLSEGGSGINDNGNSYNVIGISVDSAAAIAYRTLTVYLSNGSNYEDARYYSIQSAIDLFGPCSQKVASTTNAFYAIGVGQAYVPGVISNFATPITKFCVTPAIVTFQNYSNNGLSYKWDFGNGKTSTLPHPTATYLTTGNYTVTLIVDGGSCGADTLVKTNYISVNASNPCTYNMPQSGTTTETECNGFLMDSGGSSDYHNNTDGRLIISPPGASLVILNFHSFDFEEGRDYLFVYDGNSITSPLIGQFHGKSLPKGGTIISSGGSITLRQKTDAGITRPGFVLDWQCATPTSPPISDFAVSDTVSCSGEVKFTETSLNNPKSWYWDFGDGKTDTAKTVVHTYQKSGIYTVILIASNAYGSDTIIKHKLVRIVLPYPKVASGAVCGQGSTTLFNTDTTVVTKWYSSPTANDPFHTGHAYTTPVLQQTTTFWVEEYIEQSEIYGGKSNNLSSGTYYTNATEHYLVFDAHNPFILKSVKVFAGDTVNCTISLKDSAGKILDSVTMSLDAGANIVDLNFDVPIGKNFRLAGPASPNLYMNDGGCAYPYHIGDFATITESSDTSDPTGCYYYFYQWKISDLPCKSPRVPVEVFVSTSAPTADFSFKVTDSEVEFTDLTINKGTNFWEFGEGGTSVLANPIYTYPAVGTYPVTLKVDNACGVDSVTKNVTIFTMGIEKADHTYNFNLYPNPNTGSFTIELTEKSLPSEATITIHDISGKVVYTGIIQQGVTKHNVAIGNLRHGLYLVRIVADDKFYTRKMIVK